MSAPDDARITTDEPTILGHPRALYILFFAEMWERFCYYGMRALLVFYVVDQFHKPQADASVVYGAFTALVYALGIFGGYIADRVLGYKRSILLGGAIMALGEFTLMLPKEGAFLAGLAVIVVGNGLFKPNISTLVGKLYKQGDPRRDSGFTIFYMGINLGAFLAPIFCARISRWMSSTDQPDYRYGFMLAGIGMILGLLVFGFGSPLLRGKGDAPPERKGFGTMGVVAIGCAVTVLPIYFLLMHDKVAGLALGVLGLIIVGYFIVFAVRSERVTRDRIFALLILLLANMVFWASFEQAGNSLNFFARQHIEHLSIAAFHWTMVPEDFQSVNAIGIVLLGPIFAALWVWLARRNANPSIPAKFGLGLVQVGLGFMLLLYGMRFANANGLIPWFWLVGLYTIHTTGELCLSPVGLSAMTKLAPEKMAGMVMGSWFLSIACADYVAGLFSSLVKPHAVGEAAAGLEGLKSYSDVYTPIIWMAVSAGVLLFVCSRLVNKLMHGVR